MISIIIPFFNEEENLTILNKEIADVMDRMGKEYEVVYVNDGSTDSSKLKVQSAKVITLRKRFGKGEALRVGVENTTGEILVFMDGDLQDNPKDIPLFIEKLEAGYDFINGVRVKRKDSLLVRSYSKLAGLFLNLFLNSPYTDINCGFKAFKREVLENFYFYANNFRFLPLVVYQQGFKVTEIPVDNRQRKFGKSKFGSGKLILGIFDTLTAYFLFRFSEKPLHFFGTIGSVFFGSGLLLALWLSYERIFFGQLLYRRPALLLAILLIIVGLQVIMTGMIGELIVYLNKKKTT